MARKLRGLLGVGLCGLLLLPHMLLAQTPLEGAPPQHLQRLGDRELSTYCGQGMEMLRPAIGQSAGAIKLWDEWTNPGQPGNLANPGKNHVIMICPLR